MIKGNQVVLLGADPEVFFREGKKVVPSSKFISKEGVNVGSARIVRDGIQAEINTVYVDSCRQVMTNIMRDAMVFLFEKEKSGIRVDFSTTIEIDPSTFRSIDDEDKKFGCTPSFNLNGVSHIKVNPMTYRKRSAGGHIHIGALNDPSLLHDVKLMIPILDAVIGNTMVLMDKDPSNKDRRRNYGRAGEHRLPKYGIEYRTPSNFWLRSPVFAGLIWGLARTSVNIAEHQVHTGESMVDLINKHVPRRKIEKAINQNDFAQAMENFIALTPLWSQIAEYNHRGLQNPINAGSYEKFIKLAERGIENVVELDNPRKNWERRIGFESFLRGF